MWIELSVGDLLRIEHGFAFKGEHFSETGKYVVLTPGNVHEKSGFRARPGKDRFYSAKFPERYLLRKGDLIIAMTEQGEGLLGAAALIPESSMYLHNQRLGLVKEKPQVSNRRFLYYLFNTDNVRQQIRNSSSGAKVRHTSPDRIYSVKVRVPDKTTQKKIAAILSVHDDLIENNRRRITLLEKMAEEIYREWFVRMRFPGHQQVKFEKGLPEGWGETPSSAVFEVLSGGTPKTDVASYWDGEIPFFTPKDATEHFYVLKTEKSITPEGLSACNSKLYPKDTIFITARGTVGKLALAHCHMAMNQSCYALAPKFKGPIYFHFLAIRNSIDYLKGVSKCGVFNNIIVDTFKTVPILMPSGNLIELFNKTVMPVFFQTATLLEMNQLLTKKRDQLLPRLMSGKLPVENLDIHFPPSMRENQSPAPILKSIIEDDSQKSVLAKLKQA